MDLSDLLGLSIQTQAILASGYAAQMLAYRGLRVDYSTADILFGTLIFGLPCLAILAIGKEYDWSLWFSIPVGFLGACLIAALWRIWVRKWIDWIIRAAGITRSSDHKTAWAWIVDCDDKTVSEVCVECDDGTYLYYCGDPTVDNELARAPIHLGADGSVALRVTHIKNPKEDNWEENKEVSTKHGDNLTYISAKTIRQIDIRYEK